MFKTNGAIIVSRTGFHLQYYALGSRVDELLVRKNPSRTSICWAWCPRLKEKFRISVVSEDTGAFIAALAYLTRIVKVKAKFRILPSIQLVLWQN